MNSLTTTQCSSNLTMPLTHSAVGRENPNYKGCKAAINAVFYCPSKIINSGSVPVRTVMTGCYRRLWPAVPLYGILTLFQPVAHSVRRIATALYSNKGHKLMHPHTQKLTLSVSTTKQNSLKKQHDIIGHALDIFCAESNQNNRSALKHDSLELIRMLDDLSNDLSRTSRFNVFDKSKQLIAERVTFDQAKQYQNCIVKFAGMEVFW